MSILFTVIISTYNIITRWFFSNNHKQYSFYYGSVFPILGGTPPSDPSDPYHLRQLLVVGVVLSITLGWYLYHRYMEETPIKENLVSKKNTLEQEGYWEDFANQKPCMIGSKGTECLNMQIEGALKLKKKVVSKIEHVLDFSDPIDIEISNIIFDNIQNPISSGMAVLYLLVILKVLRNKL